MAASTPRAAALMSRFRSNCSVTLVWPSVLDEVISLTDAIRLNWRSSGVATDEAMVSALAPGKFAPTAIVGKSTCGSGDTGRNRNATAPASAMAIVRRVVAIGRRMKGSDILISKKEFQMAKGKRQTAKCLSAYFALPLVVATAFDNIARNW